MTLTALYYGKIVLHKLKIIWPNLGQKSKFDIFTYIVSSGSIRMRIVQDACKAADLLDASDKNKAESIIEFEKRCIQMKQQRCELCRSVSLRLTITSMVHGNICNECKNNKVWQYQNPDIRLPIWYDNNNLPQYTVPKELSCLREAEKLLISQVSVYIPLQHLSFGQLGAKGHVCCFEKNLSDICTTLPRLPSDVTVVRILRKFTNEEGEVTSKAFSIRKKSFGCSSLVTEI